MLQRHHTCFWLLAIILPALCAVAQIPHAKSQPPKQTDNLATLAHWADEDARWIITDPERKAFNTLTDDQERELFIENFWRRRDPTPDTLENEFKDEHYRRMLYANEQFASDVPGWHTDRGRIYILFGRPDQLDSIYVEPQSLIRSSGNGIPPPPRQAGNATGNYPAEIWRYRYIDGIGIDVRIYFVDSCGCGDYHIASSTIGNETPVADSTLFRPPGEQYDLSDSRIIDWLQPHVGDVKWPEVRFKDLEEVVTHKISVHFFPFSIRTDFVKITCCTDLVAVTVAVKRTDLRLAINETGVPSGRVNVFGRVTTSAGHVVATFEDIAEMPSMDGKEQETLLSWKALALRPGRYRLDLALLDVTGNRVSTWSGAVDVPNFDGPKLANSSLILADNITPVTRRRMRFVIGSSELNPRLAPPGAELPTFRSTEDLNLWMQLYNLAVDPNSRKSHATIQYEIADAAKKKVLVRVVTSTDQLAPAGQQVTLTKRLPLSTLPAGRYIITVRVKDELTRREVTQAAPFIVDVPQP